MNKVEALKKIVELEKDLAELRAIVNLEESLLSRVSTGDTYFGLLTGEVPGKIIIMEGKAGRSAEHYADKGFTFQTRKLAEDYIKALNTFLLLRHQPGTIPLDCSSDGKFYIHVESLLRGNIVSVSVSPTYDLILNSLSPMFSSRKYAEEAIEAIGKDAIIHMVYTFQHTQSCITE